MEESLEQLIEQFMEPLLRAALAIGFSKTDAEELVQDTFVTFLKARDRFEGRSKLSTFLFGILYNKARELRRLSAREQAEENIEQVLDDYFDRGGHWIREEQEKLTEPERALQQSTVAKYLMQCMDKLAMPLKMAFQLKEVEGIATPAICEAMMITPNNLGVLLFRARRQLQECLRSKGATEVFG